VIYDSNDQLALMKQVIEEYHWDSNRWSPRNLLAAVSRAKDDLVGPDELAARAADFHEERTAKAYKRYQVLLGANNAADFDDLIFKAVVLLRENEDILGRLRDQFRHVLIDEYQDTNHAQYVFADLLAAGHRNLCVVGDDDQSIYKWRGADIRNVLEFEEDYPDAKVVRLEQNYRSTKTILAAANGVIAHNVNRKGKQLWTENEEGDPVVYYLAADERDEAEFVAGEIRGGHKRRDLPLRAFTVLYRTHAQSRAFEDVFVRHRLPYQIIGGVRFYERKEIKDVLAYLRVAHNPADEVSLERAIGVPKRGVGPATLRRLRELGEELEASSEAGPLYTGIRAVARRECDLEGVGLKTRSELAKFSGLIDSLRERATAGSVADLVREVAEKSGIVETLRAEGTPEAHSRIENIQELVSVAADFDGSAEEATLASFLENASLMADIDVMKEGDDGVVLMTMHNAKGLEFPVVFVVGLEQGLFPHSRSFDEPGGVEEERRLCYVAMTRAQKRLYLTHARTRTLYGYARPEQASMFLEEVPKDTLFVAGVHVDPAVAGAPGSEEAATVEEWPSAGGAGNGTAGLGPRGRGTAARGPAGRGRIHVRRTGGAGGHHRPAARGPAVSSAARQERRYTPGEKVAHPRWGEGVVVGLTRPGGGGSGAGELYLKVAFPGRGIKTFPSSEVE